MDAWSNPYIRLKVPERPSADASISRLRKAVLRPIMEDDQQIMEYYLPLDGHVGRLEESFEDPASMEVLERLKELGDLDGGDPQLDDTYKVSKEWRSRLTAP
jgi:RNA polymerase II-associated factor 1